MVTIGNILVYGIAIFMGVFVVVFLIAAILSMFGKGPLDRKH